MSDTLILFNQQNTDGLNLLRHITPLILHFSQQISRIQTTAGSLHKANTLAHIRDHLCLFIAERIYAEKALCF